MRCYLQGLHRSWGQANLGTAWVLFCLLGREETKGEHCVSGWMGRAVLTCACPSKMPGECFPGLCIQNHSAQQLGDVVVTFWVILPPPPPHFLWAWGLFILCLLEEQFVFSLLVDGVQPEEAQWRSSVDGSQPEEAQWWSFLEVLWKLGAGLRSLNLNICKMLCLLV